MPDFLLMHGHEYDLFIINLTLLHDKLFINFFTRFLVLRHSKKTVSGFCNGVVILDYIDVVNN